MKRASVSLAAAILAVGLVVAGCAPAAPPPTPTKALAAPTKAAEPAKPAAATAAPTKAPEPTKPAAVPTAAPAKKVDFPQKGKAIEVIVPVPAGGSVDVGARLLAPALEKELGTPVQVVNKTGAGGQVGITELALSKPDGYTIGYTALPLTLGVYLDPQRKSVFGRKDLVAVAMTVADPNATSVKTDSPHKSLKDLVDAAKANPDKVTVGSAGIGSSSHLMNILLETAAGVKLAKVPFEGGAPAVTALLGGHIDASSNTSSEVLKHSQSGAVRILGIADKAESKFLPGVKTMESQGYKVQMVSSHILSAPGGTPKEIVDILSAAIKKGVESNDLQKKIADMGLLAVYMDAAQSARFWDEMEVQVGPIIKLIGK